MPWKKYIPVVGKVWQAANIAKAADEIVGEWAGKKCPKCGSSSLVFNQTVGETFFTGRKKVRCNSCHKVFKV